MKTGNTKRAETVVFKDMNSTNVPTKSMKKHAPAIKTEAFGDKENVVERSHSSVTVTESAKPKVLEGTSEVKDKIKRATAVETEKKKVQENISCEEKTQITADDLTSNIPSENYWKILAEQRRDALKETLEENKFLHHKIDLLQAENETLKEALQDATDVIEVLNQIVADEDKTNETATEPELEDPCTSASTKSCPVRAESRNTDNAFGNDSTMYDESDDSGQE